MHKALAWIFGFVMTAVTLRVLEYGGRLVGVYRKIDLPYPVEYSFGRYVDEIIDEDFTAFGIASLAFSIMIGVFVGAAVYRKTLNPARSAQEHRRPTAQEKNDDFRQANPVAGNATSENG